MKLKSLSEYVHYVAHIIFKRKPKNNRMADALWDVMGGGLDAAADASVLASRRMHPGLADGDHLVRHAAALGDVHRLPGQHSEADFAELLGLAFEFWRRAGTKHFFEPADDPPTSASPESQKSLSELLGGVIVISVEYPKRIGIPPGPGESGSILMLPIRPFARKVGIGTFLSGQLNALNEIDKYRPAHLRFLYEPAPGYTFMRFDDIDGDQMPLWSFDGIPGQAPSYHFDTVVPADKYVAKKP